MEYHPSLNAVNVTFAAGDTIDDRWRVVSLLGEGTFGRVFRVEDADGKTYALKLLKLWEIPMKDRLNLQRRFEREYETGLIESPYLVHSRARGMVQGNSYFVMDYCPGGDVRRAAMAGRLDLALLARHIMLGLRELHANGKVHRDLKPENVLLIDDNHAVLTDFGISGDQNNRLTSRGVNGVPGQRFGTVAYMPPEQLNPTRDNATVLPTTDIYSFGVMMYRLLTSELPFGPLASPTDMVNYTTNSLNGRWNRRRLLEVNRGYEWLPVLEACLVPDFKRRLQSADAVIELLPRPLGDLPPIPDLPRVPKFNTDISRGVQLRVMQGEQHGVVFNLPALFTNRTRVITIGREGDVWNHISLVERDSNIISRRHCTIEHDAVGGKWIIRDGQFRTRCATGLRLPEIFPCRLCGLRCDPSKSVMEWSASLNGTFVNSRDVGHAGCILAPGDIISIGDVKMRVEGIDASEAMPLPPPLPPAIP